MTDEPDSPEARAQSGEGYDGRYGCLVVAVVCVLLAIIAVAAAVIGKGFPTAIGLLELGAFLVIVAAVSSVIAAAGFITRKPKT